MKRAAASGASGTRTTKSKRTRRAGRTAARASERSGGHRKTHDDGYYGAPSSLLEEIGRSAVRNRLYDRLLEPVLRALDLTPP